MHHTSRVRWLVVALWTVSIFVAIPFMRALQTAFTRHFPREWIGYGVIMAAVLAAMLAAIALARARRADPLSLVVVAGCGLGFVAWTAALWGEPVEAVHFVQYGTLGALLVWALRPAMPDVGVHLVATIAAATVGVADEFVQWLTPRRYWDLRDVVINAGAAALVQPAAWRLAPPAVPGLGRRSARWTCRLAAALALLLAVSVSMTPQRLERLANLLPSLEYLTRIDHPLAEYGHRHVVPGLGVFKSRFTLAELEALDRTRADEVARILDRYPAGHYQAFLNDVRPGSDPFVYEVRVHLFSRDANLAEALQLPEGTPERRRKMTVAEREHRLLESFFGRTVAASRLATPPEVAALLAAEADPGMEFVSRAGSHLVTALPETGLRLGLLGIAGALLITDRRLGRRQPP